MIKIQTHVFFQKLRPNFPKCVYIRTLSILYLWVFARFKNKKKCKKAVCQICIFINTATVQKQHQRQFKLFLNFRRTVSENFRCINPSHVCKKRRSKRRKPKKKQRRICQRPGVAMSEEREQERKQERKCQSYKDPFGKCKNL